MKDPAEESIRQMQEEGERHRKAMQKITDGLLKRIVKKIGPSGPRKKK